MKDKISNILFIDIETVSAEKNYGSLSPELQKLWNKKSRYWLDDREETEEVFSGLYADKAGIYSEFAKVVCISVGFLFQDGGKYRLRLKSFYSDDEKEILTEFIDLLNAYYNNPNKHSLCGHNIKEFDIPFLARRIITNGLEMPKLLDLMGKKPWESAHLLDTMQMWKFGDFKNYTSLELLANILGIKSPKDDIDGSEVSRVFWEENNLERIKTYCEKDVKTVANIYLRLMNMNTISEEEE